MHINDVLYESCRSSIKICEDIPFGKSKVLMANFMKEKKPDEGWWGLAEEPLDTGKSILSLVQLPSSQLILYLTTQVQLFIL